MPERQTGAGVIPIFRVIGFKRLLAPLGVRQRRAVRTLQIRHIRPLPDAVQVEHSPGCLGCGTLRRLISSTPAWASAAPAAAFACSRTTLRRAGPVLGLGRNPTNQGQTEDPCEHQAVFHVHLLLGAFGLAKHDAAVLASHGSCAAGVDAFFARMPSRTISSPNFTESCVKPARVMALGEPSSHCHLSIPPLAFFTSM